MKNLTLNKKLKSKIPITILIIIICGIFVISVDEIFPNILINSPQNITYNTNSILFSINATDDVDVDSCWYNLNNGNNISLQTSFNGLCYQESANTTNQTGIDGNCGLNYSGSYINYTNGGVDSWINIKNVYDGNWSSYGFDNGEYYDSFYPSLNITYKKPNGAIGAFWKIKYGSVINNSNLTVSNSCFNYDSDYLYFRITSGQEESSNDWSRWECYNGSWDLLRHSGYYAYNSIYEEAMIWNISTPNQYTHTNTSIADGSYQTNYFCNDTSGNLNNSEGVWFSISTDSAYPQFSNIDSTANNSIFSSGANYVFNTTITSTNGTAGIEFEGVNYTATNISSTFSKTFSNLGAGDYSYYWWAYGNGSNNFYNHSEINYFTIAKASLSASITNNATWRIVSGANITIGINESNTGDGDVTYKLFRNGSSIGSGESIVLGVGEYDYILNSTGGQNYSLSNSIDSKTLTVNQNYIFWLNPSSWQVSMLSSETVYNTWTLKNTAGQNLTNCMPTINNPILDNYASYSFSNFDFLDNETKDIKLTITQPSGGSYITNFSVTCNLSSELKTTPLNPSLIFAISSSYSSPTPSGGSGSSSGSSSSQKCNIEIIKPTQKIALYGAVGEKSPKITFIINNKESSKDNFNFELSEELEDFCELKTNKAEVNGESNFENWIECKFNAKGYVGKIEITSSVPKCDSSILVEAYTSKAGKIISWLNALITGENIVLLGVLMPAYFIYIFLIAIVFLILLIIKILKW